MNNKVLIKAENISKKFCRALKKSLWYGVRDIAGELFRRHGENRELRSKEFWALQDVSFELRRGEVMGLIGPNGTGKSTLLKLLNGLIRPDTGRITVRGAVGALIELGAGFDPLLTGLENIYINGAVLGFSKTEIDRKLDSIIEFCGLSEFMEMPVQNYSSGMKVRLGFAVAIQCEPDILLIDEVLAVGDAAFQAKCKDAIMRMKEDSDTAVILVSHNMNAIAGYCSSALYLRDGRIKYYGDVDDALVFYERDNTAARSKEVDPEFPDMCVERVVLRDRFGSATTTLASGEDIVVDVCYNARKRIPRPHFWVSVSSQHGPMFAANMLLDDLRPEYIEGRGVITCVFRRARLLPQTFKISVGVRDEEGSRDLQPAIRGAAVFRIVGKAADMSMTGRLADLFVGTTTSMQVPYEWRFMDGSVATPVWIDEEAEYELV